MPGIPRVSPNLLSPDDGRDPRTLGDNIVPSPGGAVDVTDLLVAREESNRTVADAALGQIKELNERLQFFQGLEFDDFSQLDDKVREQQGIDDPSRRQRKRLDRALGRERLKRAQFEAARNDREIAIMRQIVPLMARLRDADPTADLILKKQAEARLDSVLDFEAKIAAPAKATALIDHLINLGQIDPRNRDLAINETTAKIGNMPSLNQMLKARSDRINALTRGAHSIPDAHKDFYSDEDWEIIQETKRKGPDTPAEPLEDFMKRSALIKMRENQQEIALDLFQTESLVPGKGQHRLSGRPIPGIGKLMTPEILRYAEEDAAIAMADITRGKAAHLGKAGAEATVRKVFRETWGLDAGNKMLSAIALILEQGPEERQKTKERILGDAFLELQKQQDLANPKGREERLAREKAAELRARGGGQ